MRECASAHACDFVKVNRDMSRNAKVPNERDAQAPTMLAANLIKSIVNVPSGKFGQRRRDCE